MKNLYSIGEVSKIKKITIKALRYYHKMNILVPIYIEPSTGYRYYSLEQFIHIDIIKACRDLGTSIAELQDIFKDYDTNKLLEILKVKKCEAEQNIIKMKEIINNINTLNSSVKLSKEILNNNEISVKHFEKRYIIVVPFEEEGSLKEVLYYSQLDKIIENRKIDASMERGIIYDFTFNNNLKPKYAFNGINNNYDNYDKCEIKILPRGKYLTLAYKKENENERIKQIVNYIKNYNLNVKNIIEVELFNDFFYTDSYSCQIQIFIDDENITSITREIL